MPARDIQPTMVQMLAMAFVCPVQQCHTGVDGGPGNWRPVMPTILANGISQTYRIDGPEEGAPILLINSLGTTLAIWDEVVQLLPRPFRVLRYDMRGHGGTSRRPGAETIDCLVDDVIDLLDVLGFGQCLPVGLSIGGLVALRLAVREPDRVGGLVLTHTAARIATPAYWTERIALLQEQGLEGSLDAILGRWFTSAWCQANPAKFGQWQQMLRQADVEGYIGCCRVLGRTDLRDDITRLAPMDALVVSGSEDLTTTPEDGRWLADAIPGAHFQVLEGLAHISCLEAPGTYAQTIVPFIIGTDWYASLDLDSESGPADRDANHDGMMGRDCPAGRQPRTDLR